MAIANQTRMNGSKPGPRFQPIALATCLLLSAIGSSTSAQSGEIALPLGRSTEDVASQADPGQRYAVYLPSFYDPSTRRPALLLMDPRGRAMTPLRLFQRAAEDFGYVVLSSYGSLSDDPTAFERNDQALNAMLVDAQVRFAADSSRIYLGGFSGTAHYAWTVASQLDGMLAGLVGVGGGLPAYSKPIQMGMAMQRPFAFYGVAGIGDFNYDSVRWLDEALDTTRVRHRFVTHPGRHEWPDEKIAYEAIRWFELQAMRNDWRDVDRGFLEDLHDDYVREARQMERKGDEASAYRRYREIAADFDPFGMADDAKDDFQRLAAVPDVVDELRRRDALSRDVQLYKLSVRDFGKAHRTMDPMMGHQEGLRRLNVRDLLDRAEDRDVQVSGAASRMLASAFAHTGFYLPRAYINEGDFNRALAVLRIAQEIYPDLPGTCYQLAQANAQIGELDEALEALECALGASWLTAESVEMDELLAPIRHRDEYRRLLSSVDDS